MASGSASMTGPIATAAQTKSGSAAAATPTNAGSVNNVKGGMLSGAVGLAALLL